MKAFEKKAVEVCNSDHYGRINTERKGWQEREGAEEMRWGRGGNRNVNKTMAQEKKKRRNERSEGGRRTVRYQSLKKIKKGHEKLGNTIEHLNKEKVAALKDMLNITDRKRMVGNHTEMFW